MKLPKFLRDFLIYLTTITGKSQRTRKEYEYDLILFMRFLKAIEEDISLDRLHTIDISEFTIDQIKEVSLEDLYLFMEYCEVQRGKSSAARARKVVANQPSISFEVWRPSMGATSRSNCSATSMRNGTPAYWTRGRLRDTAPPTPKRSERRRGHKKTTVATAAIAPEMA